MLNISEVVIDKYPVFGSKLMLSEGRFKQEAWINKLISISVNYDI